MPDIFGVISMKTKIKQDEFISGIIHDLKTPAIAQMKALELFLTTTSDKINSEEKDLIELTLNSCNYMQKLIDNFSFISKLNSDGIKLNYKNFNIEEVINKIILENNILIKYSNLKIKVNAENNSVIFADKIKIKKVIESLFLYSINSAQRNSQITISYSLIKNMFKFEIISKGTQMDENEILELFEKIQTKHTASSKNIGLYLSREIISAHFGKIVFKNINDKNIIGFCLPAK